MSKKPSIKKANLSFRGNLSPLNKSRITKLVQHHMAHKTWSIQDVHNFHRNGNGWAGIGYNWWIAKDGTIYEGRGFNVGAHVGGHNSTTVGIGYQGDFTSQNMTDAQLKSGAALNAWLMTQFPNVKSTSDIIGHNDLASTACPGKNFRMSELRKQAASGNSSPSKTSTKKPSKTSSSSGGSIVDYLKSKGQPSSFAARKKLAQQNGISDYTGTAKQNSDLLAKLKSGGSSSKSSGGKSLAKLVEETKAGKHGNGEQRKRSLGANYQAVQDVINGKRSVSSSTSSKKSASSSVKKGDKVTAKRLYATGSSTTNVRKSPISATVDTINSKWRNEIRLKDSSGNYIGFTRKQDLQ